MRYTRISADCHIDMPWLPPDLFTANASAIMKDRMPYVADGPDGPYWTAKSGRSFGLVCGVGPSGQKHVPGQNYRVDGWRRPACTRTASTGTAAPPIPTCGSRTPTRDGVDAEVIFGILGAATRLGDHEASSEMFRIYNDWLVDFCRHYPDRHIGLACLPYGDIDAAVKEVHRAAKWSAGPGAVVLLGHGADVAPGLGAAVAGGERRESAAALSHVPLGVAGSAEKATGLTRRAAISPACPPSR